MFKIKYQKVMEMLDKEIKNAEEKYHYYLDCGITNRKKGEPYAYELKASHIWLNKQIALLELKNQILKEIES